MADSFSITFREGVDYVASNASEQSLYMQTIRNSFCLLSWLIPNYHIRIKHEILLDETCKIKIFAKDQKQDAFYLHEKKKGDFIYYFMDTYGADTDQEAFVEKVIETARENQSISAEFVSSPSLQTFAIRICCRQNVRAGLTFNQMFLNSKDKSTLNLQTCYNFFKPPCRKVVLKNITPSDIEYYYIQPESRRYFEPYGYHLSLAFQGGGAKGVSYVGVSKAIKNMQERIQRDSNGQIHLPIKSVIGSSAGGILALAISAGIQNQDLVDLCYMMDTLVQDRLISTEDAADEAQNNPPEFNDKYDDHLKPRFFSSQEEAIKNILHNLGLVQDSLSDILFETLKEPSVQERIIALLKELNPSIAELLSFKEPQKRYSGESIKNCCGSCCCCCYSNCCWNCCGSYPCCKAIPGTSCFVEDSDQYRKVNIYGLLYAALMTGQAVENILAYALSLFLEMQANLKSLRLSQIARKRRWFNFTDDHRIFEEIKANARELKESYKYRQNKSDKRYLQNILMAFSKQLTLKEYYDLNGVQFTCTSVDLHDKIQRFFNHKTTPDLPICKAVQMTGSFPAAFLSLKWKKEWGKYYIHYDKTRREIDLVDHHFTDGGMLANFPLKFLDNEKFREKYFSHKSVEDKTLLYGFGLDQLKDFPEEDNSEKISAAMANLLAEFKYRLMYKLMLYLMKCGSKKNLPVKNVKLLSFLLSLLDALRESDRNLNVECFRYEIVETIMDKKPITTVEEAKKVKQHVKILLDGFSNRVEAHFRKEKSQMLTDEFNSIYHRYSEFQRSFSEHRGQVSQTFNKKLSWMQIEQIQRRIQNNILLYSPKCIQIYQERIKTLRERYSAVDIFMTSITLHHQFQILTLLFDLKECLLNLDQRQFATVVKQMKKCYVQFFTDSKQIYNKILTRNRQQNNNHQQNDTFIKQRRITNLLNLKYKLSPFILTAFNDSEKMLNQMATTPFLNFCVEEYAYLNKNSIRVRVRDQIFQKKAQFAVENKRLNKQNSIQLHIILEACFFSHFYYPNYMKIVEEVIADKDLKIDIISCTDYHAIFGVLYAMGYENSKIKKRLSEVHLMFEQNSKINEIYDSKEWMKTSVDRIRNLLKREWEKTQNPFQLIDQQYSRMDVQMLEAQKRQIHTKFTEIGDHFEATEQEINAAFEKILDYISGSFRQILQLSSEQRIDRFEQLLSLGKYKSLNATRSKTGQRLLGHFLKYTVNLMMITTEYIFKSQQFTLFSSKKWNRATLFKGMVINSLICAFKYRLFIYDILDKAGFDRNITLKKLYDICERKILLNFNCVNTLEQRFALINKIVKPNMPLWAALMASASLPYLEGELESRREWEMKQKGDLQLEKADQVFKNFEAEGSASGNSYISGNFISSLPLQFMTNQRLIVSKLSEKPDPQIIDIVFAFRTQFGEKAEPGPKQSKQQKEEQIKRPNNLEKEKMKTVSGEGQVLSFFAGLSRKMQGKLRFLNCWDALEYIFQYICCCCCNMDVGWYIKDLIGQMNTLRMLNIRINSHDNLILHLYYDSLIKLPLRIGTLDFFKINKKRPDLDDTIRQAQQVVRQLCDVVQINQANPKQLIYKPSSRSTIQVSNHKCDIYNEHTGTWQRQQQFYRVKFISYTKWRDFKYKYAIEYSLKTNKGRVDLVSWKQLNEDYIDVDRAAFVANEYKILLKFTYYQNRLVSNIYLLSLNALSTLQLNPARAIFSINYRQVHFSQETIQTLNQQNPIDNKAIIKSYYLPRKSKHCSNLSCEAGKLSYVLMREIYGICTLCKDEYEEGHGNSQHGAYNKVRLIAMECQKCKEKYCLKCKVNNFIVRKSIHTKAKDTYKFVCPKNQESLHTQEQIYVFDYAPIKERCLGEVVEVKNNCLLCEKYSYKLWYEKGITEGNKPRESFCGLRVCEACSFCISN